MQTLDTNTSFVVYGNIAYLSKFLKTTSAVALLLTRNEGTCGVVGCLDFCIGGGGGVYMELSIVQAVPNQHPINTVITGTLQPCKQAHTHSKNNAYYDSTCGGYLCSLLVEAVNASGCCPDRQRDASVSLTVR